MLKRFLVSILVVTCLWAVMICCAEAMNLTEYVYYNAAKGNLSAIEHYLRRGYSVDAPDSNGMTALCYAVARRDVKAYKNLKKLGASDKKDCMQRVNWQKAKQQNLAPVKRVVKNSDDTLVYTAVGLAATGGLTAALLAGDGHGSKHTPIVPPICRDGQILINNTCVDVDICPVGQHWDGTKCVADMPSGDCPTGQQRIGDECEDIVCPSNTHLVGNTCVNDDTCPMGQYWDGIECVAITCEEGYHLEGDYCVSDDIPSGSCPTGQHKVGEECVDIECPINTHLVGNLCVADEIIDDHVGDDDIYGIYSNNMMVFNLYSSPKYPDDRADVILSNTGNGNVYGMYGYGTNTEVYNAYVIGELGGNVNRKPVGTANISINNIGNGNVYGMYSQIVDDNDHRKAVNATAWDKGVSYGNISINAYGEGKVYGIYTHVTNPYQYKESINAYASNSGKAYGNISIMHTGGGVSYGVYGDIRAYNVFPLEAGSAYGNINIIGDGDIYGISGYSAAANAANWGYGNYAEGNIVLNQTGNGNTYGMWVSRENIPGAGGTAASWFSFNSYISVGEKAYGTIDIHNFGDGNSYGMYGGQLLYNAYTDYQFGNARGLIRIINYGNGNAYGMYLPNEDENGYIRNIGTEHADSEVNIVNGGSGEVIGLRGGAKTTIINSGKINIDNLGDGMAIGIYGDADSKINNSGIINIYRSAYDDNGTIINPATTIGGTAYGIYAESGAIVNNSGTITITNASAGKGIYIEPGATLTNSGIVMFNGEEQDAGIGATSVNLSSLGGGEVILAQGGQFFADVLSGTLGISGQTVLGSMQDEYVIGNALQVNDATNLSLNSKSAMFKTEMVTNMSGAGYDVVLTRKNFNTLIDNESLAQFLELNYQEGNNIALYDALKKHALASSLNQAAATVSGDSIIPSFRREDMQIYSNLSRQFNDNLFNHPEQKYVGGYKFIDVSRDHDGNLEGNEGSAHIAYGLLKNKASNGITYGIGASIARLKSDYDYGSKRYNDIFGLWVPMGYDFGTDTHFVSKLYAGYADGDYRRKSLNQRYSADVKTYQYGLSNELRYDINVGNSLRFVPAVELNLLGMHQDSFNEGNAINALKVESHDSISLEGGLGAYISKEFAFDADNKLGIQIGGIYYVEFLEPDNGMKASMVGMDQKYKIKHKFDSDRAVFSARVNYNYKNITLYGLIEQEMGGYKAFNIDAGLQYNFN